MKEFKDINTEPLMIQARKMEKMADRLMYDEFLVADSAEPIQFYIDERTRKGSEGFPLVKPIAENEKFFWYICPYCKRIHIESKRTLTHDKPVRLATCGYRFSTEHIQFDMEANPLAMQENKVDSILKAEWEYMKGFNDSGYEES